MNGGCCLVSHLNKIRSHMNIFHCLINWIRLRNYKSLKINNAIFIYDPNFDPGIREYYLYISRLLINALQGSNAKCIINFGLRKLKLIRQNIPIISIDFQIEHTLVKPGGRGGEHAPVGKIGIRGDPDSQYLCRIANYHMLNGQDIVIEYSRINLVNIRLSGIYKEYLNKSFLVAPTLYHLKSYSQNDQRQYDTITLFQNPEEPRRKKFTLTLTARNVRFENLNNIFDHLDSVYLKTKILINIRQTDFHDTLEELRILPALRCGVIVISEDSPLKECCMYSEFILWETLENLPDLILDVQRNYQAYHKKIFGHPKFYTRMNRLSTANQLMAIRIRKKIESLVQG